MSLLTLEGVLSGLHWDPDPRLREVSWQGKVRPLVSLEQELVWLELGLELVICQML